MKIKLANKFIFLGLLLYIVAGIMAISGMNYSAIVLLAAIIFLAFGFFVNVKFKWKRLFKKKV
ncbi:unnamed protein product [marine sediment metagenome]|uniref:Uncharacterized protein n=1 Tax=marine sediment metagenome TaxID=412755 RepID=X0TSF4_9ZZZZ